MTQTGTTCPTQAEDAIADAFSRSAAWQELTETANETEAAAYIFFDSKPLPVNGHVFDLGELFERRVSMMLLMAAEEGFTVTPGDAQGVIYEGGQVDIVVERWIRDAEKNDPDVNQNRFLVDLLVAMMLEATEHLLDTKGQRWMQPMTLKPPVLNHYKEDELQGRWQQATITVRWGQTGESND